MRVSLLATDEGNGSRIINCTAQIFAHAYKTRRIPSNQGTSQVRTQGSL